MFERFMERATLADDSELDYLEDEGYDYEDYEEPKKEAPVSSIRPIRGGGEDISRIATCWPATLDDISTFADQFRRGVPVILNLAKADDKTRQRITDFATGVSYGLRGHLEQISDDVLLMTPKTMKIEEHRTESKHRLGH